ncbi:MAG: M3 family metallopeptidase [Bdellovibrionales bacterium]|nr:M3 family metallopeptidase [Bdellovibrionales bacterium]
MLNSIPNSGPNSLPDSDNPPLHVSTLPDEAIPFSQIQLTHFLPALEASITLAKANIAGIKQNTERPSFENTILALETCSEDLDRVAGVFGNLESAAGGPEMMKLAPEIYRKVSEFSSDVSLDPELFSKVNAVYENKSDFNLTPEQDRLLEKTYKSFVRNGARLSPSAKEKIRQIDQELSSLAPKFSENVLTATNAFEMWITDSHDLEGLPEGAIEAAAMAAKAKNKPGQWLITLQIPSYLPFLTYGKNRTLREKLWRAASTRCFKDNCDNQNVIVTMVQLKHQRAQLLGFKNHADFVLSERMAKDPSTVRAFLDRLLTASKQSAQKDLQEVEEFAKSLDNLDNIKPWDFSYYSEKLKETKYSFNEEDLRPFFQLEFAIEGVFEHARRLYGLIFKLNPTIPAYHPEVKVFDILEEATGRFLGLFYADFFPRETKRGGAWMTSYRDQGLFRGQVRRPHISIVCNFTRPTETKPALLSYDEVRTLFHEFGHALHGILSECTYRSLAGTNVYWDFVELPSQIMENWVGEKEGLDLFAKHYKTLEPIPAELVEKLKRSQKFQAGWSCLRQIQFAFLDLAWHSTEPSLITDVDLFEAEATAHVRVIEKVAGTNSSCFFGHICAGGYSAGYYSYKWAEVLDADAFEFFKEEGLFDPTVATRFKEHILSKGGTEHPMELYKKFRGREPDPEALLRRDGLL